MHKKMSVAFSLSQQTLNHKCEETQKLPLGKCGFALKYKLGGLKKRKQLHKSNVILLSSHDNARTCVFAPGVIGLLKLFKSQIYISESFAPDARRLL